jgi:TonB family protein
MLNGLVSEQTAQPTPVPRLLVELPPWRAGFSDNLRDLVRPRAVSTLEAQSAPGEFWDDVFVQRELPWRRFLESGGYHIVALALLIVATRFFAMPGRVIAQPAFDRSQVVFYRASEYLPPLDTRSSPLSKASKADPEFSPQPIISVPREADNHAQTIVAPPHVKLGRDVALPNMVAWSEKISQPKLEIAPAQLTLAADITRMSPKIENNVVAPPPDVRAAGRTAAFQSPQAAVVAPPPSVEASSARSLGDLNIGQSAVIAPSPQLAVAPQSASARRGAPALGGAVQVVPPPPSLGGSGASGGTGRAIALNLHPTVGAPPAPPQGNRRGSFAATPSGHTGASGTPGSEATGASNENGSSAKGKGARDLPSGLYVGAAPAKSSPVAGSADANAATKVPDRTLTASVNPPRVTSAPAQPDGAAKLSEAERAVFGDRKFYSLTLNMPNLNSAGGSWVIRFAEMKQNYNPSAQGNLTQPSATHKVDPGYPLQLMRENVAGTVILYAIIHADGSVGDVRVLSSVDERLDQYASQAVAKWQFHPATKDGTPVDVEATFKIPFKPQKVGTNF